MDAKFEKYKGIHPGFIVRREIDKRSLKQRPFALSINEHPQTINAITKGKRLLTISQALKIEKKLKIQEGTLVVLQAYYDIEKEKQKQIKRTPNLNAFRNSLFWDTDIRKIDWEKKAKAIIRRVYERGNEEEKNELLKFYGSDKIRSVLNSDKRKSYSLTNNALMQQ